MRIKSRLRISPLAVFSLLTLCCFNAWLLTAILDELAPTPQTSENSVNQPRKSFGTDTEPVAPKQSTAYNMTLARPLFFKTRAPFVPPPPPPPAAPKPPPQIAIPDPGLSVAGIIINNALKKAYLFKKGDPVGAWASEGENISGWTVHEIRANGITLQQSSRTIELQLYLNP